MIFATCGSLENHGLIWKSSKELLRYLVWVQLKSWDKKLSQAEFANNHAVTRRTGNSLLRWSMVLSIVALLIWHHFLHSLKFMPRQLILYELCRRFTNKLTRSCLSLMLNMNKQMIRSAGEWSLKLAILYWSKTHFLLVIIRNYLLGRLD